MLILNQQFIEVNIREEKGIFFPQSGGIFRYNSIPLSMKILLPCLQFIHTAWFGMVLSLKIGLNNWRKSFYFSPVN